MSTCVAFANGVGNNDPYYVIELVSNAKTDNNSTCKVQSVDGTDRIIHELRFTNH